MNETNEPYDYSRPGLFRRLKHWIFGEREPEFSFGPDRETILLARDLLLARRARLGFLSALWVPAYNRYELVRSVREICARTGLHEDEAIGWLGITRKRFAAWSAAYPRLEERFRREEETRERWAGLLQRPTWLIALGLGVVVAMLLSMLFVDREAARYFSAFDQTTPGMKLWVHVTFMGDATLFYLFTIFGVLLTWTRDRRTARALIYFMGALFLAGLVTWFLKFLTGRPRPELFLNEELWGFFRFSPAALEQGLDDAYKKLSFPSGHATHTAAVAVSLALLFPRYRFVFFIYPLAVGISRVVLVQHFPADVIGGWTIGALTALWLYNRMYPDPYSDV